MNTAKTVCRPSIGEVLDNAPWQTLEAHLDSIRERVDKSIGQTKDLRERYRDELLTDRPDLQDRIKRPSTDAIDQATRLLRTGSLAASDGTIAPVPLLGGSKIQVGVVIVSNQGEVVDLVTRVFEAEITSSAGSAREYFSELRSARGISNLLSRAIMLYGERKLLIEHDANWRLLHGELIPHELRTGAGRPNQNLRPTFDLARRYIDTEQFIAAAEASDDIDILNAAILLEPGEYIEISSMRETLRVFLDGDQTTGQRAANFNSSDRRAFTRFSETVGPKVSVVLVKAGPKPFLIECSANRVEESVAVFMADSLWTRGLPTDGSDLPVRGFPFHIDLADQVARTLFKASDFRGFVEARLFDLGFEAGLFEIDARRTRG